MRIALPIFASLILVSLSSLSDDFKIFYKWSQSIPITESVATLAKTVEADSIEILKTDSEDICTNSVEKYSKLLAYKKDSIAFEDGYREKLYGPTEDYEAGKGPCLSLIHI